MSLPPRRRPPRPDFQKKVTLEVRAQTWRENQKPHDVESVLRTQFAASLLEIVPAGTMPYDGAVLIEFDEARGEGYSMFGVGPVHTYGTNLTFKLTVLSGNADVVFSDTASASTPSAVSGQGLYEAAIAELDKLPLYAHAGHFVGAALGVKACLPALLPTLVRLDGRKKTIELFERVADRPADAREEAYLALARGDYDSLVKMGGPAVEPLLAFVDEYGWPEHVSKAARALGEIGDPRAARHLMKRAKNSSYTTKEDRAMVLVLLEAVGRTDDGFALADLQKLVEGSEPKEIAEAAKQASEQIRKRRTGK